MKAIRQHWASPATPALGKEPSGFIVGDILDRAKILQHRGQAHRRSGQQAVACWRVRKGLQPISRGGSEAHIRRQELSQERSSPIDGQRRCHVTAALELGRQGVKIHPLAAVALGIHVGDTALWSR